MEVDSLYFKDMAEFISWKEEFEETTSCKFILATGVRLNAVGGSVSFHCNQSGPFIPKGSNKRTRLTKKIDGKCTAGICVKYDGNGLAVTVYRTHYGHKLRSGTLQHCPLSKEPFEISPLKEPFEISPLKEPFEISPLKEPFEISPLKEPLEISPLKEPFEINPLKARLVISPLKLPLVISPPKKTLVISPLKERVVFSPIRTSFLHGSVDLPSNIDTDQSTASPSTARQDTEDNSETSRSAVDLTQQTSDSRKRKRTTPDRLIIDSSVDTSHKDDNLGTNSSGSEPTDDPEYYPKGVVVVQPTAVEDELESAPLAIREEPVVSRNEAAPTSNQRVLFAINRNPKKTPIPILPKITAVHSGYIPTAVNVAHVSQPRHSSTPYDRPQNRQRHTRAPPPPPPPPQQSGGFDPTVLQEQQQQEEHEAKMELFRLQIELATAQLRMAEDEHRIRFAKLQVELQTAQMEHDAKAAQLSTASSS
ncbi:uncharacterized protein [Amphiura filiformis]|uniref:uncharacterized protein isoform X2 n=1 Tax=Amphiura filiformis TaxID=82378 RepID=UPI003B22049E